MAQTEASPHQAAGEQADSGVLVGVLVALTEDGVPWVAFGGNPQASPCEAQSVVQLANRDVGRRVALLFERGDRRRPIVLGCMLPSAVLPAQASASACVQVDDEVEQTITARHRLVLRCGEASITLQSDGTVHIQGRNLLTEATATNRLRGASIHLN